MVACELPNVATMVRALSPAAALQGFLALVVSVGRRPNRYPRARAAVLPAFAREMILARSSSANDRRPAVHRVDRHGHRRNVRRYQAGYASVIQAPSSDRQLLSYRSDHPAAPPHALSWC